MCQAIVYLGEEVMAEDVVWLEPVEGGVQVTTFFDEPQVVRGVIKGIDFLKHRVLLERIGEDEGERD
jgi:predicted RNA-binding protein